MTPEKIKWFLEQVLQLADEHEKRGMGMACDMYCDDVRETAKKICKQLESEAPKEPEIGSEEWKQRQMMNTYQPSKEPERVAMISEVRSLLSEAFAQHVAYDHERAIYLTLTKRDK